MDERSAEQLAALWTRWQPSVASFVAASLGDHAAAQDVVQNVAVVLVRRFKEYDRSRPFVAWAIGIAKKEVLRYRRECQAAQPGLDERTIERLSVAFEHRASEVTDVHLALMRCLQQVRGRARAVLERHYAEELKLSQIAQQLGAAPAAIRMLLIRTRQRLRECIEQRLGRGAVR